MDRGRGHSLRLGEPTPRRGNQARYFIAFQDYAPDFKLVLDFDRGTVHGIEMDRFVKETLIRPEVILTLLV